MGVAESVPALWQHAPLWKRQGNACSSTPTHGLNDYIFLYYILPQGVLCMRQPTNLFVHSSAGMQCDFAVRCERGGCTRHCNKHKSS